jgi:paraquat-inducible protein B
MAMDPKILFFDELSDAFNEVAGAARSVRVFADYLEQNPDALLRGKGASGGRQ